MNEQIGAQHVVSRLMRESLMDKTLIAGTEAPVRKILPNLNVIQIGGASIMDRGHTAVLPLLEEIVANKPLEQACPPFMVEFRKKFRRQIRPGADKFLEKSRSEHRGNYTNRLSATTYAPERLKLGYSQTQDRLGNSRRNCIEEELYLHSFALHISERA